MDSLFHSHKAALQTARLDRVGSEARRFPCGWPRRSRHSPAFGGLHGHQAQPEGGRGGAPSGQLDAAQAGS